MSTTAPATPAELKITPRDRRFGREAAAPRLWHGGRVEATAIYNALSTTFPKGEAFFVEGVRRFRDGASPALADEIRAFTTQEAIHSREHDAFNKRAAAAGYDLRALEAQVEKRLAVTKSRPPIVSPKSVSTVLLPSQRPKIFCTTNPATMADRTHVRTEVVSRGYS